MTATNRRQWIYIAAALLAGLGVAMIWGIIAAGANDDDAEPEPYIPSAPFHQIQVQTPPGVGTLRTGLKDIHDNPTGIACATCHQDRQAETGKPLIERAEDLSEFHTDIEFEHGSLSCSSCHHPEDRDQLRLSDGQKVAFADVIELCAQCHSTQYRSYKHGAHGGMTGHWDLSQGGQVRNNCVACHSPHAPAFPTLMPAPPPRDRFFKPDSAQ